MKLSLKFFLLVFGLSLMSMKGDKQTYQYFDMNGKAIKYNNVIKNIVDADVVFFGELHNNSIGHWMELQITKDLFDEKEGQLMLGAEMFESDNQLLIDEYFSGKISKKSFEGEARLWKNYKTDYKPLFEFAHENNLKFVATNIPRRYASLVNKRGLVALDSLSPEAQNLIAPLPVDYDAEVDCYKSMVEMMKEMGSHDTLYIAKAQAIKDATMAHFIIQNLEKGKTFIHYNGAYHSDNHEGIIWWLKRAKPELKILSISTVEQDTITSLSEESLNSADYILCVPSDMTKTY